MDDISKLTAEIDVSRAFSQNYLNPASIDIIGGKNEH